MNTQPNITNQQLELGLSGPKVAAARGRRESRIARAAWWFARMREAVHNAMDWRPAAEARPEQIWLPNAERQIRV